MASISNRRRSCSVSSASAGHHFNRGFPLTTASAVSFSSFSVKPGAANRSGERYLEGLTGAAVGASVAAVAAAVAAAGVAAAGAAARYLVFLLSSLGVTKGEPSVNGLPAGPFEGVRGSEGLRGRALGVRISC